jgi:ADP-ribose pyrophosphatase YjhB (NUDIX family)
MPPEGVSHGATGLCVTADGEIVVVSEDGQRWDLPGGRPEEGETLAETLWREILEEACATVTQGTLLGFCRGVCLSGPEAGRAIVRSVWRADVELEPWEPRFETRHRRLVRVADVVHQVTVSAGLAGIVSRALHEAGLIAPAWVGRGPRLRAPSGALSRGIDRGTPPAGRPGWR